MSRQSERVHERQLSLRSQLWSDLDERTLWHRKKNDGFTTIPRNMGLILTIMDEMSKGKPVSSTYIELWCRTFDEMVVSLSKAREMATHSGFSGQRAERTWRDRMKILQQLGFISIVGGSSGAMSYALLLNPYHVIERYKREKLPGLRQDAYFALAARAIEIGANDLTDAADIASTPKTEVEPTERNRREGTRRARRPRDRKGR